MGSCGGLRSKAAVPASCQPPGEGLLCSRCFRPLGRAWESGVQSTSGLES